MTSERVTASPPDDARVVATTGASEDRCTQLSGAAALAELERVLGGRPPREVLDAVRCDLGLARS